MMDYRVLLLSIVFVGVLSKVEHEKDVIATDGDIIIGGLFPLHEKSNKTENKCGNFYAFPGYLYMEAMLFAIDRINQDPNILPNITLGVRIYDTCLSTTIGADRAKEFIKLSLMDKKKMGEDKTGELAGVVGAFYSDVSATVANFLRVFEIPQISYASSSISLSNKDIHSYFLRTVPPDSFQAQAMVDIIKKFGWNYVATVNSHGDYGMSGIEEFWRVARKSGICFDYKKEISAFPTDQEYKTIVRELVENTKDTNMSVVVLFMTHVDARRLLEAASRSSNARKFTWIGSDGWSTSDITEKSRIATDGVLVINFRRGETLKDFKDYFMNLTWDNYPRKDKRCFKEFWEGQFKCHLDEAKTPFKKRKYNKNCTGSENLKNPPIKLSPVRVVMNAVYAFAHGLDSLQKELCRGKVGMCARMSPLQRPRLLEHLKNVTFLDRTLNTKVKFDENGETSATYDIFNFQQQRNTYVRVGTWDGERLNGKIRQQFNISAEKIQWRKNLSTVPSSFCTKACDRRAIRSSVPNRDFMCCWKCQLCEKLHIVTNNTCESGPTGWIPNQNGTGFLKREVEYPKWSDPASVAFVVITLLCLFLTIATVIVYIIHKQNRLIKASGRELCFVMLAGIALCFAVPLLFMAKPNDPVCYARNMMIGLALAMCYAPLFMKINRIYRIFTSARSSVARPPLVTPRMQLLLTLALVSIQFLFTTLWFVAKPVKAVEKYYSKSEELVVECNVNELSFSVNLGYVMILMLLCTAYAFKTRSFPKNFNESKYIGITMYITCAVWMVFFPFYLNTEHSSTHIYLISGACVIIGLVTLIGLFAQKVYIVYFVTDLSTDDLVMTSRSMPRHPVSSEEKRQTSNVEVDVNVKVNGEANSGRDGVEC